MEYGENIRFDTRSENIAYDDEVLKGEKGSSLFK